MPQNDNNQFVSRGGTKLQAALDNFQIDVTDLICLDIGSSTGGFVDCLLQNGAQKVYAVDTAYGELAWKLRNDPRVVVMERTNAMHLDELPEQVDLITIDAGWTKLELVLPVIKKFLKDDGKIIALLKPHYEILNKRGNLVRGVVPKDQVSSVKNQVTSKIEDLGFRIENEIESPILGGAGNIEFLLLIN